MDNTVLDEEQKQSIATHCPSHVFDVKADIEDGPKLLLAKCPEQCISCNACSQQMNASAIEFQNFGTFRFSLIVDGT